MEIPNRKKVELSCVMKYPIEKVWPVFKDSEKMNAVIPELNPSIIYLNDKKSYEQGAEFKYILGQGLTILAKCLQCTETKTYSYIRTQCDMKEPIVVNYENSFALYSNTVEGSTYIKWEKVYLETDPVKLPILEIALEEDKKSMKEHFEKISSFLKKTIGKKMSQVESVVLNKSQKKVWSIISDFREFVQQVPIVAEEIEYDGDPHEIGSKFVMKWVSKNIICNLRVSLLSKDEQSQEWTYEAECYDGKPYIPKQTLTFVVKFINDSSCLLTFKHVFESEMKLEFINLISKEKKQILNRLKTVCS